MPTIVITGIAGRLASLVAGALAAQPATNVIGVGRELPARPPPGVRLARCNMGAAALLELLAESGAHTVIHLDIAGEEPGAHGDDRGNLFRAVELLAACERAGVGRLVLRSSTLVYGARHDAPAYIDERTPPSPGARASLARDYAEIERIASQFAARQPGLRVIAIRCAGIVGGGVASPLGCYLTRRPAPAMLGFDPRVQVLHADDAAVAFALAALSTTAEGPINVAAPDPLPLGRAIALAGGRPMPLPPAIYSAAALARDGLADQGPLLDALATRASSLLPRLPFDSDYLQYACVADTARARELLGWQPQHTAEDSLREQAATAAAG
jgi:UDP-glucose 4-epimerase